MKLKAAIPGISSHEVVTQNVHSHFLDVDEVYPGQAGLDGTEILNSEYTSFLILFGIFFPSVTGIMAGTNRSGDLKVSKKFDRFFLNIMCAKSKTYMKFFFPFLFFISKAYNMRWKKLTLVFVENASFSFYGPSKFFRLGEFEQNF